jgi:hypothetical protein
MIHEWSVRSASGILTPNMPENAQLILHGTAVISTLDGVTTVLVAFLFVCLIFPSLVKNRPQYYAALALVVLVILLHTLTLMLNRAEGFIVPAGVFTGLCQIAALLLLVLSVGGLTARQLAGDMARAYEVMRRGESTKEVIIPIGGQTGRARTREEHDDETPRPVYHIDSGATAPAAAPAQSTPPPPAQSSIGDRDEGIPLS